jgi:hypothetical protein
MFGLFKKKQPTPVQNDIEEDGPIVVALLLESASFPIEAFLKEVAKTHFAGRKAKDIGREDSNVFGFQLADDIFACVLIDVPAPSDVEGPLETAWMWPKEFPISKVKKHRAHLLMTMTGGKASRVERRLVMTAVTALAANQPGVLAVWWMEATQVLYPPVFIEMAREFNAPDKVPLYLWVDVRIFGNEDGTLGMFTTGLKPLGLMELEIPRIEIDPEELREWTMSIMYYMMDKGPVLLDGQTIGMTEDHKMKIKHRAGSFGQGGKVIRLVP